MMVREKLHIVITLLAALTVTVVSAFLRLSLFEFALRLVIVIAVFFVLGSIIKTYLDVKFKMELDFGEFADEGQEGNEGEEGATPEEDSENSGAEGNEALAAFKDE